MAWQSNSTSTAARVAVAASRAARPRASHGVRRDRSGPGRYLRRLRARWFRPRPTPPSTSPRTSRQRGSLEGPEVADRSKESKTDDVVGVGYRDQLREWFEMTPTDQRAQELVAPGLRPGEHVLKLAECVGSERSEVRADVGVLVARIDHRAHRHITSRSRAPWPASSFVARPSVSRGSQYSSKTSGSPRPSWISWCAHR